MGKKTGIEWCDASWNPWRGCHKVTAACKNCYMFRGQRRFGKDPSVVVRSKTTFRDPLQWKNPLKIFVCSWSDFWIKEADQWRHEALDIMSEASQHTYIVPTKRPRRALRLIRKEEDRQLDNWRSLFPNMWGLVSAGTQKSAELFLPILLRMPFTVKGVSVEPMLEPITLRDWLPVSPKDHHKLDWVVVGCESSYRNRVGRLGGTEAEWIESAIGLVEECKNVSVFVKQIPINGKVSHDPNEWPRELRIREWPE